MFGIGFTELLVIVVLALLLLGPEKLPDAARGFGKLLRELRDASRELEQVPEIREIRDAIEDVQRSPEIQDLRNTVKDAGRPLSDAIRTASSPAAVLLPSEKQTQRSVPRPPTEPARRPAPPAAPKLPPKLPPKKDS